MSHSNDETRSAEALEVVKLKVDGASTAVNTLRDQQTARGLSLICPFPALEVEIPVSFGSHGDGPGQSGTIHRIGVEDDPETGLPRLRLSIRANNTRATVIAPPDVALLSEASRMTAVPEECAKTDLDLMSDKVDMRPLIEDLLDGPSPALVEEAQGGADPFSGLLPVKGSDDPAWAGRGELPLPSRMTDRSLTRRRRRAGAVAAWLVILGVGAGGVYLLDRAGVVDVESVRNGLAGFTMEMATPAAAEALIEEALPEEALIEEALIEEALPEEALIEEALPEEEAEAVAEPAVAIPEEPDLEFESLDEEEPAPVEGEGEVVLASGVVPVAIQAEAGGDPSDDATAAEGEITLILPTRWPAEYSNAYRLRNPNGVVVDVPGGLVKKEGWLEVGREHAMIRSVKAVQRETGARFVVFVNGEIPRFMTAPRTGGVALRLFDDGAGDPGATEQVALLDK